MIACRVQSHFMETCTPRNNPWKLREIEKSRLEAEKERERQRRILWPSKEQNISLELVKRLIDTFDRCSHDPSSLRKYFSFANVIKLLRQAQRVLSSFPNVIITRIANEATNVTVVGDTHGQFHDLIKIFRINGYPSSNNWYVFNGDFVDRGAWGVENALTILSLKLLYPDYVHILRGNHETLYCTSIYGFMHECEKKYSKSIHSHFQQTFCRLPLACVLLPFDSIEAKKSPLGICRTYPSFQGNFIGCGRGVFIVHGGLYRRPDGQLGSVEDLLEASRYSRDPDSQLLLDVLWSDPQEQDGLVDNHMRGCATFFGPDITKEFLFMHGLHLVVRSHEGPDAREKRPFMGSTMMEGYAIDQVDEDEDVPILITVFSAPDYPQGAQSRGNKAAYLLFRGSDIEMQPKIIQFSKADRPNFSPYTLEKDDMTEYGDSENESGMETD